MFLSILKWSIISLTIIYLIHHLYMFFLNTLTVPKVKDLVNKPTEQYDEILKTLQNSGSSIVINGNGNKKQTKHKNNETISDDKMTEELSSFLNELKKNPTNNNNISNNNMNFSNSHSNSSHGNEPSHILSANDIGLYSPY